MNLPMGFMKQIGTTGTEVLFANPKKTILRFHEDGREGEIRDNVTSIEIHNGSAGVSIIMNFKTEEGVGLVGEDLKRIKEVLIYD